MGLEKVSIRWALTGLLLPIASFASEVSSSSVAQAVEVTQNINNAITDGLTYGFLIATLFAVASMSVGIVASMINRSVGG